MANLDTRAAARAAYVARARAKFVALLPGHDFDAPIWDCSPLKRTASDLARRIHWTERGSRDLELPRPYAEAVKAWAVVTGGAASTMHRRSLAARWLWAGIAQRLGSDAARMFSWDDLRAEDLRAAEQLMIASDAAPRVVNKTMLAAAECVRHLSVAGVAPAIVFTPVTPRIPDSSRPQIEDLQARGDGALTPATQAALADIFHRATEPRDVLWSSVLAICIGGGLRINEALTLPLDCVVEEPLRVRDVTGGWTTRQQVYLLRHKSKSRRAGGAGRRSLERVPLTDMQAALVRLAVSRLHSLCEDNRRLAARLEASEPRWRLHPPMQGRVGKDALVAILGCTPSHAAALLREIGERDPDYAGPGFAPRFTSVARLEQYLTERQDWEALWVVKPTSGRTGQRASASLLCLRANDSSTWHASLPTIQAATLSMLRCWLADQPTAPSVFSRWERDHGVRYREPDGSPVRLTSHDCRRLFVTTALVAGATPVDLARWQGREHIGDLRAYDKRSMGEKVAAVRQAITTGRLQGQVAQAYVQLADDVRDGWLEGQVQAMHVTPYGLCVHDFAATPCPLSLNCVKGCKDYLHDPSNAEERQGLVQLRRRTREVLEALTAQGPVAAGWVREQEETLAGLDHILGLPAPAGGGYVAPYAGEGARGHTPDRPVEV